MATFRVLSQIDRSAVAVAAGGEFALEIEIASVPIEDPEGGEYAPKPPRLLPTKVLVWVESCQFGKDGNRFSGKITQGDVLFTCYLHDDGTATLFTGMPDEVRWWESKDLDRAA